MELEKVGYDNQIEHFFHMYIFVEVDIKYFAM